MNIIITGAPGTGKTTLIENLKKIGYECYDEVSRKIIIEQQRFNGKITPWDNTLEFAKLCYEKMFPQLFGNQLAFFDRGIPDLIAYLKFYNFQVPDYFYKSLKKYHKTVFFLPYWEEIYVNDPQRPQSKETAKGLHSCIYDTYASLGFELVDLGFSTVSKRVEAVRNYVEGVEKKNSGF